MTSEAEKSCFHSFAFYVPHFWCTYLVRDHLVLEVQWVKTCTRPYPKCNDLSRRPPSRIPCVPKIWAPPTQTLCPRKPPTQTILEHKSPTAYLPPLFIDILSTHGNCQSAQRRHVLRFYTCNKLYILLLLTLLLLSHFYYAWMYIEEE